MSGHVEKYDDNEGMSAQVVLDKISSSYMQLHNVSGIAVNTLLIG